MSKAAREYHLIDLVGTSYGGFQTLAGARQVAREEGLRAWDIFHGNDRIEYHDPDDRKRSEPIRKVWIHGEVFAASRLSMMRIMARRKNAATVVA